MKYQRDNTESNSGNTVFEFLLMLDETKEDKVKQTISTETKLLAS